MFTVFMSQKKILNRLLTCEIKGAVSTDSTCPHPETTNTPPVLQTPGWFCLFVSVSIPVINKVVLN